MALTPVWKSLTAESQLPLMQSESIRLVYPPKWRLERCGSHQNMLIFEGIGI
jgi:hypothetical protein